MSNVLFRGRDKEGNLRITAKKGDSRVSLAKQFREYWEYYNVPLWRIKQIEAVELKKVKTISTGRKQRRVV